MKKNKASIIFILFLLLFYLFPISSFAKELQLIYEKKTEERNIYSVNKEERDKEKLSHSEIIIGLGEGYFCIVEGPKKTIFDFKKRRVIYLYEDAKIYKDTSLFSIVDYLQAEFRNRLFIRESYKAAGVKDNLFAIETLFSLEIDEVEKEEIKEERKDEFYQYVVDGETIVECKFTEFNIPECHKDMFAKFLLYYCNLHPQIWQSLLLHQKIPQVLNYKYDDFASVSVQLNLKSAEEDKEKKAYVIPSDFKMAFDSKDELNVIMYEVLNEKNKVKQLSKEEFIDFIHRAINEGNYLDAVLATSEYSLQSGDPMINEHRKIVPYVETDRQLALFVNGMHFVQSKETAKKAVKFFDAIKIEGLKKGYIIDIMKASAKMEFDALTAKDLFIKTLKKNPYITGVWKNLGDLFQESYNMETAWECWDIARSLYPQHPMLEWINKYEKWLLSEYPEFF